MRGNTHKTLELFHCVRVDDRRSARDKEVTQSFCINLTPLNAVELSLSAVDRFSPRERAVNPHTNATQDKTRTLLAAVRAVDVKTGSVPGCNRHLMIL